MYENIFFKAVAQTVSEVVPQVFPSSLRPLLVTNLTAASKKKKLLEFSAGCKRAHAPQHISIISHKSLSIKSWLAAVH